MTDHPALSALTTSTAIPTIAANTLPPMSFVLPGADGQPLVSISLTDGSIEYGPNYEPDEAARVFWAAMQAMFGSPEAVFGHGLAAKVDAEMAGLRERAEKAEAQVGRVRNFLEDMAGWCSPHGVAAGYARRGLDALDGVDRLRDARSCSCGRIPDPGICQVEHSAEYPAGGHCACACDKETK